MDFMKLLKSFEELLYEVMVMLVFYPRTLYLTLRHPQRMMDYADTELGDVLSEQYDDTLSPPLFLMICLALSHVIGRAVARGDAGRCRRRCRIRRTCCSSTCSPSACCRC
ncbi:hypothetical protein GVO57_05975 [Sphingomonas changnyeongensis]|uniref:Uncharacterized protein n=1 Tax=Sphingomonas changnyeongensis TaxID=2698679 RepID=A0A7Z2S973_9SPHN|nr:hypothetical protein [Sphingomonas changnyeongensis]QHL90464.1 hypothetical protein GVO57_05975 [Sphingomonas changnyeongensis]